MNKPVLVVMAAGMGSRYGGMKQIDPVGPNGQVIVDYSLYDARRAGFETVIFVIKHEIEDAFKAAIGDRVAKAMNVKYAFQQLEELPAGYTLSLIHICPGAAGKAQPGVRLCPLSGAGEHRVQRPGRGGVRAQGHHAGVLRGRGHPPVSYTHLDVYKRQGWSCRCRTDRRRWRCSRRSCRCWQSSAWKLSLIHI